MSKGVKAGQAITGRVGIQSLYSGNKRWLSIPGWLWLVVVSQLFFAVPSQACIQPNGMQPGNGQSLTLQSGDIQPQESCLPPPVPGQPGTPTTSVNPSYTGSFTLSWHQTSPAGNDFRLYENGQQIFNAYYGPWSYTVTGKSDGEYEYAVKACNENGCGLLSNSLVVTVVNTPGKPTHVTVPAGDTDGNVVVSWGESASKDYYEVQRQYNSGDWRDTYTGGNNSVSLSALADGVYLFRVRGCNTYASYTRCGDYRTSSEMAVARPPNMPSSLTVPLEDDDGSYTIRWGEAPGTVSHYELQQNQPGVAWSRVYNNSGTHVTLTGRSDGVYSYRVRACKTEGSFVSCGSFQTANSLLVAHRPGVPGDMLAPATNTTGSYTLNWGAASGNVTRYLIRESLDNGPWNILQDTETLSFSLADKPLGAHRYQVSACNGPVCSDYTEPKTVTVQVPDMGSVDIVSNDGEGNFSLNWSGINYLVEWIEVQENVNNVWGSWTNIGLPSAYEAKRKNTGDYQYRLRFCGAAYCGTFSTSSPVSVPVLVPSVPEGLQATSSDSRYIALNWLPVAGELDEYYQARVQTGEWRTTSSHNSALVDVPFSGEYVFEVRACNQITNGDRCSAPASVTQTVSLPQPWAEKIPQTLILPDAPALSVSAPMHDNVGTVGGEGGVSGGSATYNIPIVIPPGRNNMQPSVAVAYSSKSGNGILGTGWSLKAGSRIQRCGRTLVHDGYKRGVQLDHQDRLCLDGERLLLISGDYGVDGAVYRTEVDTFARVTQSGSISSGNSSFTVALKNGQQRFYGITADSRFVLSGANQIMTWALAREEDRSQSRNAIHYRYTSFGAGEFHLSDIYYTGRGDIQGDRRIAFAYDPSGRDDVSSSYIAGGLKRQTQRLKAIATYYGTEKIRQYNLSYQYSAASGRSLLKSIEECGYFGVATPTCLRPTHFSWQDAAPQFVLEKLGYRDGSGGANFAESDGSDIVPMMQDKKLIERVLPHGDSNGDGSVDWEGRYVDAEGMDGGTHNHALNNLDTCSSNPLTHSLVCFDTDFNQDGLIDRWDINNQRLQVAYSEGNWQTTQIPIGMYDSVSTMADFNGDSWPDVVIYKSDAPENVLRPEEFQAHLDLYLHTGNPQAPYPATAQRIYSYRMYTDTFHQYVGTSVQYLGDMDGNGLVDFLVSDNDIPGTNSSYIPSMQPVPEKLYLTQRNAAGIMSFVQISLTEPASRHKSFALGEYFFHYFADVNGDGLADWIAGTGEGNQIALNKGNGEFADWKNLGSGAYLERRGFPGFNPVAEEPGYIYYPKYASSFRRFDYNGDGRAELLVPNELQVEGCRELFDYSGMTEFCGDELYGNQHLNPDNVFVETAMPSDDIDDSLYQYDAIYFQENRDGSYTAVRKTTPLMGSATQTAALDAFGNGLEDFIFTYGCRGTYVTAESCLNGFKTGPMADKTPGVYINRNRGSATGNERYATPDMLIAVENGLGYRDEWTYRPLSSKDSRYHSSSEPFYAPDFAYLEQLGAEAQSSHFHFTSSMNVVAEHRYSNAVGGLNHRQFRYQGAMFNNKGRGFQGFSSIVIEDISAGLKTRTDFHQVYPLAGRPYLQRHWILSDSESAVLPHKETRFTWRFWPASEKDGALDREVTSPLGGWTVNAQKPYFAGSTKEEMIHRDLPLAARTELFRQIKLQSFDTWGNVLTSTQTYEEAGGAHNITSSTVTTYVPADENGWWLNKPLQTVTTANPIANRSGVAIENGTDNTQVVTIAYLLWDDSARLPLVVQNTPSSGLWTKTTTQYTADGLPKSVALSADGEPHSRDTTTLYSSDGYFPDVVTNAAGHIKQVKTHPQIGQAAWSDDANSLRTTLSYDAFGRVTATTVPGAPTAYTALQWCDALCPANSVFKKLSVQAGKPVVSEYQDLAGRTLQTETEGFNGELLVTRVDYNHLGQKTFESAPAADGVSSSGVHYLAYDALGRLTHKRKDQTDSVQFDITYDYNRFTTHINANGLLMSRTHNGLQQLVQTVDANNGITRYAYDGAGNPIVIEDAQGSRITTHYNALKQKNWVKDPNMGQKHFTYNGFGEVASETSAAGQVTRYARDILGRVTHRYVDGVNEAYWEFDSAENGIGLPAKEVRVDADFTRTFYYDSLSRVTQTDTQIGTETFSVNTQYDTFYGRPKGLRYPTGLALLYEYNDKGYLARTLNAASNYVYQVLTAMDSHGNWRTAQLGGGVLSVQRVFDPVTGQMRATSVDSLGLSHQQVDYQYDQFGNLSQQASVETRQGTTKTNQENYTYDDLHRLTLSTRTNGPSINYAYDAVGNLTLKDDFATAYAYDGGRPNAVSQVTLSAGGTVDYAYDANGNRTHENGVQEIWYNAYNKPVRIDRHGYDLRFDYAADQMRYRQVKTGNGSTVTTLYVDKLFEQITTVSGGITTVKSRHHIGDIAVVTDIAANDGETHELGFFHRDRLGSPVGIANELGELIETHSFDPFGKPRTGDLTDKLSAILASPLTTRGFTDHEHLDAVKLIHMNGRAYDYELGRFLSVDPVIQSPANSQSINPYTYIFNNPLSGVDPTGYNSKWTNNCAEHDCNEGDEKAVGEQKTSSLIKEGTRYSDKNAQLNNGEDGSDPTQSNGDQPGSLGEFASGMVKRFVQDTLVSAHSYMTGLSPEQIGDPMGLAPEGGAELAGALAYDENAVVINVATALIPGRQQQAIRSVAAKRTGPEVGGGADLKNLSPGEQQRIQNAANRSGANITVVGSQTTGTKLSSDFDFVIEGGTSRSRSKIKNSLPQGPRGTGDGSGRDFHDGPVHKDEPHIIFSPEPKG